MSFILYTTLVVETGESKITQRKFKNLSPANLEIMKVVWEMGHVTINQVFDRINELRQSNVRRTTIQVQLKRLEEYGWLKHTKKGRTFYYSAIVEKNSTKRALLEDMVHRVFEGSRSELLKCLLQDSEVNPEDIRELREMLKDSR